MDSSPSWTKAMARAPEAEPQWNYEQEVANAGAEQRTIRSTAWRMQGQVDLLAAHKYDGPTLLFESPVAVQDLSFNCILAAANTSLAELAKLAPEIEIPPALRYRFMLTRQALERLWDDDAKEYYSYDVRVGELIRVPTVAMFMPLFAETASPERAEQLRQHLVNPERFRTSYPVPTVPIDHSTFEEDRYWEGPMWVLMNWFVARGAHLAGFVNERDFLCQSTLELVDTAGFWEYFNTFTGRGLGSKQFTMSAALSLDLMGLCS